MEQGKKPIDQTKSFSIDTHTNLNPINSLSSQHSARLLAIVRSQNPSSSEWDLILPITSTTSSHSTILNILARIHQAIKKQTTLDLQIHAIRQVLKFTYTQQTAKPDFKLEYEEWAAYMHLSLTDYLIDHQIITLAYKSLEANLLSFKSESVKAIFHLRLVLIFLEEEDLVLAERHLYYANSLSPENSVIRLECEICSARLYFHQGYFVKCFDLLSRLLEKDNDHYQTIRTHLITIRIISAMMSPPHLRQSYLQKVKGYLIEPDFSYLKESFEIVLLDSIIIPHSKPYKSLACLLPQSFISNGTFINFIRTHNLWSLSIKHNEISCTELSNLLDFHQPKEIKRYLQERNEIDPLKVQIILSKDPKENFYVRLTRYDHKTELGITQQIENMSKKLLLSTLSSSKPNLFKSGINSSVTGVITISPDISENEPDEEKPNVIEIDKGKMTDRDEGFGKEGSDPSDICTRTLIKMNQKVQYTHDLIDFSDKDGDLKKKEKIVGKRKMIKNEKGLDLDRSAIGDSPNGSEPAIYEDSNRFDQIDLDRDDHLINDESMKFQQEQGEEDEIDEIDLPAIPGSSPVINEEKSGLDDQDDELEKPKRINENDLPPKQDRLSSTINQEKLDGLNDNQDDEKVGIVDDSNKEEKENQKENESLLNTNQTVNQTQEKNELILNALSSFSKALRSF